MDLFTDAVLEYDLLTMNYEIEDGIRFVEGSDGFPAYAVDAKADIKSPYKIIMPEKLYEFAVMATIRTDKPSGYLFAVVNPLDTIVQFGIRISATPPPSSKLNVTIIYTDSKPPSQAELVTFQVPYS